MISLPDFTASPVTGPTAPKSDIAPKELIGNVNFSQVLSGAKGGGVEVSQAMRLRQAASATELRGNAFTLLPATKTMPAASGKAFPLSGTALPNALDETTVAPKPSSALNPEVSSAMIVTQSFAQPGIAAVKGNQRDAVQTELGSPWVSLSVSPDQMGEALSDEALLPVSDGSVRADDAPSLPPAMETRPDEDLEGADQREPMARAGQAPEAFERSIGVSPASIGPVAAPARLPQADTKSLKQGEQQIGPQDTSAQPKPRAEPALKLQAQSEKAPLAPTIANGDEAPDKRVGTPEQGQGPGPGQGQAKAQPQTDAEGRAAPIAAKLQSGVANPATARSGETAKQAEFTRSDIGANAAGSVAPAALGLKPTAVEIAQSPQPGQSPQIAQAVVQAGRTAVADLSSAKPVSGPAPGKEQRSAVSTGQSASSVQNMPGTAASIPLAQTPVIPVMQVEADPDMPPSPPLNGPASNLAQATQTSGETGAQPASSLSQNTTPLAAAPAMPMQSPTPAPVADTGAALRLAPQLENAIEQLTETRSAAQANRPEVTLRHQEFGAITMRLDASGSDLRATLSARDPGFVPAIQTALAERSVAASSDAASTSNQRGNEQGGSQSGSNSGSNSAFQGGFQGQGWNSGGFYGSSTGSGQGTSQPYPGQTRNEDEESGLERGNTTRRGSEPSGDGEIFA